MTASPNQFPYQKTGTEWLQRNPRGILADEAGLGKTNQLLLAAEGSRTLIVAPAALLGVWVEALAMWAPGFQPTLTSYHKLARLPKQTWETVIFDEAHYLKGRPTGKKPVGWVQAADHLQADRMWLATGTPMPNWAHELYTPLRLLHGSKDQRFSSYWRWLETWFEINMVQHRRGGPAVRQIGKPHDDTDAGWRRFAIDNGLVDRWLRRERDKVLPDLPPLTSSDLVVPMTGAQDATYRQMRKLSAAEIEETGHEIVVWSEGAVWGKLLRLSTGLGVEDSNVSVGTGSAKLSALLEWAAERTRPFMVLSIYQDTVELAVRWLEKAGFSAVWVHGGVSTKEREARFRSFRTGKAQVLVGTTGVLAEGLTFTNADACVFLERDPRPGKVEQATRRIHRIGQEHPCEVLHLYTENTVDMSLGDLIRAKTVQQTRVLTSLDLLSAGA
jgi:SNF2 family DNA or RNA helicase